MGYAIQKLLNNIANLFKVKTILSISIILSICILTFKGKISTEAFMAIAGSIITYYFKKDDRKIEEKGEEENGN